MSQNFGISPHILFPSRKADMILLSIPKLAPVGSLRPYVRHQDDIAVVDPGQIRHNSKDMLPTNRHSAGFNASKPGSKVRYAALYIIATPFNPNAMRKFYPIA